MAPRPQPLQVFPIPLADEILSGDSIAARLLRSLHDHKLSLRRGDILVVKHKIVSKAEGSLIDLATIRPSAASRVCASGSAATIWTLPSSSSPWRRAGAPFVAGAVF